MMKLNSLGESFINSVNKWNYDGIISINFYKDLIKIYLLIYNEYRPIQFKKYAESLSILNQLDRDKHKSGSTIWKHYIDRAKQELLDEGLIEKTSQGTFVISAERKGIIFEKYSEYIEESSSLKLIEQSITLLENSPEFQEQFNSSNLTDARERILRSIVQRRGQKDFRQELLKAYEYKCAISECNAQEALEAAHIIPYLGPDTNRIQNGILLRADIHTLFDLRLITINDINYEVIISTKLKNTYYEKFEKKVIILPKNKEFHPSKEALKKHREESYL